MVDTFPYHPSFSGLSGDLTVGFFSLVLHFLCALFLLFLFIFQSWFLVCFSFLVCLPFQFHHCLLSYTYEHKMAKRLQDNIQIADPMHFIARATYQCQHQRQTSMRKSNRQNEYSVFSSKYFIINISSCHVCLYRHWHGSFHCHAFVDGSHKWLICLHMYVCIRIPSFSCFCHLIWIFLEKYINYILWICVYHIVYDVSAQW